MDNLNSERKKEICMNFEIKPLSDIPDENAHLLGHDDIISNLKRFLEDQNMITPLSIAIHGDWGSGKTSIMKTLAKKLNQQKFAVLFFEAWKYEYANPSLGLIAEISDKYGQNLGMEIIKAGAYILSNKFLGIDPDQVYQTIKGTRQHTETLTKHLKQVLSNNLQNKILVIVIDDLDRCDVENTLQLLAIIKLFLDLPNCVCIAAVDFNRLKQAWQTKYSVDKESANGSEYLDKIFQIRIGITKPTPRQIQDYLKTLVEHMPDSLAALFSMTLPKNPRSIKRIINLTSYRKNLLMSTNKEFSVIFWTLLENMISNGQIIYMADQLRKQGSSIGHLITEFDDWAKIKEFVVRFVSQEFATKYASNLSSFFALSHKITKEFSITREMLDNDFKVLYAATNETL